MVSILEALSSIKLRSPEKDTSMPFTMYGKSMNFDPYVHHTRCRVSYVQLMDD